jgi:hypothetical protein
MLAWMLCGNHTRRIEAEPNTSLPIYEASTISRALGFTNIGLSLGALVFDFWVVSSLGPLHCWKGKKYELRPGASSAIPTGKVHRGASVA